MHKRPNSSPRDCRRTTLYVVTAYHQVDEVDKELEALQRSTACMTMHVIPRSVQDPAVDGSHTQPRDTHLLTDRFPEMQIVKCHWKHSCKSGL